MIYSPPMMAGEVVVVNRGDFWCRVLAWLQIGGGLAVGGVIYGMWALIFGWISVPEDGVMTVLKWIVILSFAFPPLLAGALTLSFADRVAEVMSGGGDEPHVLLRVLMAIAGLWSAGFIGFLGFSVPPIGFFAVLGLVTAAIAIMGHDWVVRQPSRDGLGT